MQIRNPGDFTKDNKAFPEKNYLTRNDLAN
jgi:hypothetical protein